MDNQEFVIVISASALVVSLIALTRSNRTRRADSFAKLYDEYNSSPFGAEIERIGRWLDEVCMDNQKERQHLTESEVRRAYRNYYEPIYNTRDNTKGDPLENARRIAKAWFIKCYLYRKAGDLSIKHFQALLPRDRADLMFRVFQMTREQTDVWMGISHDPKSRNSSDEQYFIPLERMFVREHVGVKSHITRCFTRNP